MNDVEDQRAEMPVDAAHQFLAVRFSSSGERQAEVLTRHFPMSAVEVIGEPRQAQGQRSACGGRDRLEDADDDAKHGVDAKVIDDGTGFRHPCLSHQFLEPRALAYGSRVGVVISPD